YKSARNVFSALAEEGSLSDYNNITVLESQGDAHKGSGDHTKAISNYEKALKIAQDNQVTPKITDLNSNLAGIYSNQNNVLKAEEFYSNSLSLATRENSKRAVQEKEKVADFYNQSRQYDEEIRLRQSSLEDVEAMEQEAAPAASAPEGNVYAAPDSITSQKINYKIANAYIMQEEFDKAIPYLQKSIAEADDKEDLVVQKDATR